MMLRTETEELLSDVERSANKKFRHREAIGAFFESAQSNGAMNDFLDAAFLAKFLTKSFGIMKRIGVDGEGYDKLSTESESTLARVSSLLRSLNTHLPDELRKEYDALFFSLTQESLARLLVLLDDLAMLKNWTLDGGGMPGTVSGDEDKR